ncbi:phage holin family protein [Patiriisocius marinus]|uniref:Holin-X, holin superfamily III n=1 Tax=Patiriisocius marinus TaxID=1397112 RepID=A0A5J4IYD8_9FLAO|nr:phage holin family protein [Patiriisocius marinus]GER58648.1 hypothetical protein ULMA_07560 [Patiriisocius marinus]
MAFKALSENIKISGEKTQEYLENTAEYYKLRLFKSSMKFTTSLVSMLVLGSIGLLFLAFVSVGIALMISRMIGFPSAGFFIVAGFYLIVLILIAIFGKKYIVKAMLSKFSDLIADEEEFSDTMTQDNTGVSKVSDTKIDQLP